MTIKNSYNLSFLFLVVIIGISNVALLLPVEKNQAGMNPFSKENASSREELLKVKRREAIMYNSVALFYFRQ